jgi:hypothetical protein
MRLGTASHGWVDATCSGRVYRRYDCSTSSFIYPIYNHNWRNISTVYIYITRPASNEVFPPSNKIHREVGRAKDLSAPLYVSRQSTKFIGPRTKFIRPGNLAPGDLCTLVLYLDTVVTCFMFLFQRYCSSCNGLNSKQDSVIN